MPTPTNPDKMTGKTFYYADDDFRKSVEEIGQALQGQEQGLCLLFAGPSKEDGQHALSRLSDYTGLNMHQVNGETLVGERPEQTQGNLRETFDSADGGVSMLIIEPADALFAAARRHQEEEDLDADALTVVDYLFQRIKAFGGIVVLCIHDAQHLERARAGAVDAEVRF